MVGVVNVQVDYYRIRLQVYKAAYEYDDYCDWGYLCRLVLLAMPCFHIEELI